MKKKKFFLFVGIVGIILIAAFIWGFEKNNSYRSQSDTRNSVSEIIEGKSKDYNLVFYKKGCPYCKGAMFEIVKGAVDSSLREGGAETLFVDTEGKAGRELVKKYHVRYAATVVKVRNKKEVKKMVYAEKVAGKYRAKEEVVDEVFRR
ncbi:hypothetical protein [Ligilactobacillus animalis]|uniref:hypothetical protein n=1 Tax=Ligilactobacillus animalis TaxID=1605 RepID=UPI00384C1A7A